MSGKCQLSKITAITVGILLLLRAQADVIKSSDCPDCKLDQIQNPIYRLSVNSVRIALQTHLFRRELFPACAIKVSFNPDGPFILQTPGWLIPNSEQCIKCPEKQALSLNREKCIECASNSVRGISNPVTTAQIQKFKENYQQFVTQDQFSVQSFQKSENGAADLNLNSNEDFLIPQSLLSFEDIATNFRNSAIFQPNSLNDQTVSNQPLGNTVNLYLALKTEASDCLCPLYTHVVSGKSTTQIKRRFRLFRGIKISKKLSGLSQRSLHGRWAVLPKIACNMANQFQLDCLCERLQLGRRQLRGVDHFDRFEKILSRKCKKSHLQLFQFSIQLGRESSRRFFLYFWWDWPDRFYFYGQSCLSFDSLSTMQHCQAILNMCALNLFRNEHETCLLYNDILAKFKPDSTSVQAQQARVQTRSRRLQDSPESTVFEKNPDQFYSSLSQFLVADLKYDSSQIFIQNIKQYSENYLGLLRLPLRVNVYTVDGVLIRTSPFEKEFFRCNFSFRSNAQGINAFTLPIHPGQNFSLDCSLTLDQLLTASLLLYELFLESSTGSRHPIPVKLSTLNENSTSTLTPFEDDISKDSISSQNFNSRFFLVDNILTKSSDNEPPKVIRFARTMDLLFYRAWDSSTAVMLRVTYQSILPDSETLPELTESFRLGYFSSPTPFEVPLLFGTRLSNLTQVCSWFCSWHLRLRWSPSDLGTLHQALHSPSQVPPPESWFAGRAQLLHHFLSAFRVHHVWLLFVCRSICRMLLTLSKVAWPATPRSCSLRPLRHRLFTKALRCFFFCAWPWSSFSALWVANVRPEYIKCLLSTSSSWTGKLAKSLWPPTTGPLPARTLSSAMVIFTRRRVPAPNDQRLFTRSSGQVGLAISAHRQRTGRAHHPRLDADPVW